MCCWKEEVQGVALYISMHNSIFIVYPWHWASIVWSFRFVLFSPIIYYAKWIYVYIYIYIHPFVINGVPSILMQRLDVWYLMNKYDKNKNTKYSAPIVSWPNPKQWVNVHTSDLMMIIRQSIYILSIIIAYMSEIIVCRVCFCSPQSTICTF